MISLRHDGSIDGLVCAVCEALNDPDARLAGPDLFAMERTVQTDPARAATLMARIRRSVSADALEHVLNLLMSGAPDTGTVLVDYLRVAFRMGRRVDEFEADPAVKRMHDGSRKVAHEIHRFKGLLRFRELRDGTYWGPFEPDHDIVLPVALHFRRRMPAHRFWVHDVGRGMAIEWDGNCLQPVTPEQLAVVGAELADGEPFYQELWQRYYRTIAVKERLNRRLQIQWMPLRYHKYLTEIRHR